MSTPLFTRPELLTHPNIPKPLHGVNPRSIKGNAWWDAVRKKAYAENNYHCWACGIHKYAARFKQHLEAHESYDYDYENGRLELKEIVALCHSCHNFIHSGRLWVLLQKKEVSQGKFEHIMMHGFSLLQANNLKPCLGTALNWLLHAGYDFDGIMDILSEKGYLGNKTPNLPWSQWHIVIDGKSYYSKFANEDEWYAYYNDGKKRPNNLARDMRKDPYKYFEEPR